MREAETVLGVLRERGRRGLPVERLYRMMFNRELFLLAYGRIYSNQEGYSGRAYGFVSLQVRAAFLKIILPPE